MIRYATKKDKDKIKKMWQQNFEGDNFNNFFFDVLFDQGIHYLYEVNSEIISIISRFNTSIKLNDEVIKTSFLCGICTDDKYKYQGYMNKLLKEVLDVCANQELVTILTTHNPKIYAGFNFKPFYQRKTFTLKDNIFNQELGILENYDSNILLNIYARFVKRFNGFKLRKISDFDNILAQKRYNDIDILVMENGEGYALYEKKERSIVIHEICYLTKRALFSILSILKTKCESLIINTSKVEKLELLGLQSQVYDYGLIRINNQMLFKRLYPNIKIEDLLNTPLWFREDY